MVGAFLLGVVAGIGLIVVWAMARMRRVKRLLRDLESRGKP